MTFTAGILPAVNATEVRCAPAKTYSVQFGPGEWCVFFVSEDGHLAATGTRGTYGHCWGNRHGRPTFSQFLRELVGEPYYLLEKMSGPPSSVNYDRTVGAIREHLGTMLENGKMDQADFDLCVAELYRNGQFGTISNYVSGLLHDSHLADFVSPFDLSEMVHRDYSTCELFFATRMFPALVDAVEAEERREVVSPPKPRASRLGWLLRRGLAR